MIDSQGVIFVAICVLFILTLKGLSSSNTAKKSNLIGMIGMMTAILIPLLNGLKSPGLNFIISLIAIGSGGIIGFRIAKKIDMIALPQLVAAFHSLVGLAAVCISVSVYLAPHLYKISGVNTFIPVSNAIEMALGAAIGAITFTGSIIAFGKLQGFIDNPLIFEYQHKLNLTIGLILCAVIVCFVINQAPLLLTIIILLASSLGMLLVMPIGGADMPVVVSMLNSYSGWAAAGIGFTLNNHVLIIVGALVGASGAILSSIMCKGMNRSLFNVIIGGFGNEVGTTNNSPGAPGGTIKTCGPEDASIIIKNANSVIFVPGYGMAVSQAQHAIKELADILKNEDISVKFAIHPVAGRMPGHMNVLLAEANIPYEDVMEIDEINHEFARTDVVIVLGANDITNPSAKTDPTSPIYGMPVLDVDKAKTVLFVKRSMASGYAGIDNPLFYKVNTMMVLGDAKKVCEGILQAMKMY
ncbi:MAG: NAD(P)(+) transhydrogenase (Re/Si-specific) subunit beta [Holosporales bacterium]|jgi:NAD(P) transhydrogenase subunit beta|nr:NAD(P)(+) transhydrogenase (Re/Si-specific) subunit beta [Holosporales bacterium]